MKDQHVNTTAPARNDGVKRMPHERDEAPDAQRKQQRSIIGQAARDIDSGLVDTDLHNQRGLEKPRSGARAEPQTGTRRD